MKTLSINSYKKRRMFSLSLLHQKLIPYEVRLNKFYVSVVLSSIPWGCFRLLYFLVLGASKGFLLQEVQPGSNHHHHHHRHPIVTSTPFTYYTTPSQLLSPPPYPRYFPTPSPPLNNLPNGIQTTTVTIHTHSQSSPHLSPSPVSPIHLTWLLLQAPTSSPHHHCSTCYT